MSDSLIWPEKSYPETQAGTLVSICQSLGYNSITPRSHIGNGILSFAFSGQIVSGLACKLTRQVDLEDAEDSQSFFLESVDGN